MQEHDSIPGWMVRKTTVRRQENNNLTHVTDWQEENACRIKYYRLELPLKAIKPPRGPPRKAKGFCGAPSITRPSGRLTGSALQSRTFF
jgi:hypothetical protein